MSYQVDEVEITPVTSAPEHKKPRKIDSLVKTVRTAFEALCEPLAQQQVLEVTDEPESNEDTALEEIRGLSEPLSVGRFFELAEKSSWELQVTLDLLWELTARLSFEQILIIGEKSRWNLLVFHEALQKIDEKLSVEQIFKIAEQTHWNAGVISGTLKKLREPLSFNQFLKIANKSEHNFNVVYFAFNQLDGTLTSDQFFQIAEISEWNNTLVDKALKKLRDTLSFDQILAISEKSDWDSDITIRALTILGEPLSVDQFTQIAEKSNCKGLIVYAAFEKINGSLTVDQFLEITEKSGWNYQVLLGALKKIGKTLSIEEFTQIAEQSNWNTVAIFEALKKIKGTLSVEQVLRMAEKIGWRPTIIHEALKKIEGTLSVEQVLEIVEKTNWDYYCSAEAFGKLEGTLSFEQFLKVAEKSGWNGTIVFEAIKKIDESLSIGQVIEITDKAVLHDSIIREAFKKLGGSLSFDQVLRIAEKSDRDDTVVCEAIKKIEGTLSIVQVLEIAEKSKLSYSIVHSAFNKLDEELSIEQFFEIADQTHWNAGAVCEILMKLRGTLSFDQVLEIAEKAGQNFSVVHYAINKMEATLSNDQVFELAEKSNWDDSIVCEALKKLKGTLSLDQFFQIAEQSKWDDDVVCEAIRNLSRILSFDQFFQIAENIEWRSYVLSEALKKLDEVLSARSVLKIFKERSIYEDLASDIISKLLADNLRASLDYTELISELAQKHPGVLLINLEKFKVVDSTQIAITLIENDNYGLVVDHLSHFPQKDWAQIVKLLMQNNRFHHRYLTSLLPYKDYIDEQTKNDLLSKLMRPPFTAFLPELLENETPRAVGQFGSFRKEEQLTKLAQLKEGRFYKALLVLSKAYGYSAEQMGLTFEDILSEIKVLVTNNNDKHLFDLISLAVLLFPERETELQNIRETFSSGNSSSTEQHQPRETFVQFDAMKEIFEYYAMITLEGTYNLDLLPHSLTSRITDKINTLYEKIKEYIVIAVSSELKHSSDFENKMFGNHGNFLYKFGTPEDIRVFFERAKSNFPIASKYPGGAYGGPNWATIADFGAQFWADSAQNDLGTKITLLNLAVSLQHNTGYFFDKDSRVSLESGELRKLLDFEAGGEHKFESFLAYGLENNILTQEEYDEYLLVNNKLSSATEQLPTRVDSNKIYLKQMVQEAKKQIEAIQNNPAIPFEIKMEAQAVFSKTEGFSRKENYRLYLSNLLKTISVNWENIDNAVKRFQSGNQTIYNISIAGYDLAYWYEDGKLMTIHSMDELKQQRQKLSQLLNQPIVAAQFGYVREGD